MTGWIMDIGYWMESRQPWAYPSGRCPTGRAASLDVPSTASPGSPIGGQPPMAVLVAFARGRLLALELATGRELWRYDMEWPIEIASLTPGGVVVADRRKELFHLQLADSTAWEPN